MWPLIFLFTFVFAAASATADLELKREIVFRKCCPRNESLVKYDNNDTMYEDYTCVDRDSLEKMYNISSEPLYVRNSVVIKTGFPDECKVLQMMQINIPETENLPRKNDCYDRLVAVVINGTLKQNIPRAVSITCNQSIEKIEHDIELRIHEIRKCCPNGQSFDTKYHECRALSSNVPSGKNWLEKIKISNGQIYEIQHGLNCKYEEYSVELHEKMYHLSIEGSTLFALSRITEQYGRLLPGQWCMDEDYRDQGLVARVCTRNCETFSAFCLRKCCPPGQHFKPRRCNTLASNCVPNTDESNMFNISNYLDPLKEYDDELLDVMGFGINIECPAGKFALNNSVDTEKFHLRSDSLLQTQTTLTRNYCLEVFDRRDCPMNDVFVNGVLCFVEAPEIKNFRVSFVIITISCICLALTLFVYCALPELKNLHGRTLICHVSMMLLACSCLARAQNSPVDDDRICILLGYGIYFGFVAAFAWLNVMCFDIWWTFGSVRSVKPLRKSSSERRRFIWYSVYAWSITTLLTLTMFLLDRYPVSNILDANIGRGICWFGAVQNAQTDWPHYIFFVIPMGLISCTNFVLWLLTARHCAQVKSEVHRLQAGSVGERAKKRFRIDRAKYILTGKLWVVMGAGWVSELLSTVVSEPQWLWNIVDLFNELQGVFIFLILVIKPKIYFLIKKRLGSSPPPTDTRLEKPDAQNNATSSSGRTSSTFLSRTISSDERTNLRISLPNNKQS